GRSWGPLRGAGPVRRSVPGRRRRRRSPVTAFWGVEDLVDHGTAEQARHQRGADQTRAFDGGVVGVRRFVVARVLFWGGLLRGVAGQFGAFGVTCRCHGLLSRGGGRRRRARWWFGFGGRRAALGGRRTALVGRGAALRGRGSRCGVGRGGILCFLGRVDPTRPVGAGPVRFARILGRCRIGGWIGIAGAGLLRCIGGLHRWLAGRVFLGRRGGLARSTGTGLGSCVRGGFGGRIGAGVAAWLRGWLCRSALRGALFALVHIPRGRGGGVPGPSTGRTGILRSRWRALRWLRWVALRWRRGCCRGVLRLPGCPAGGRGWVALGGSARGGPGRRWWCPVGDDGFDPYVQSEGFCQGPLHVFGVPALAERRGQTTGGEPELQRAGVQGHHLGVLGDQRPRGAFYGSERLQHLGPTP